MKNLIVLVLALLATGCNRSIDTKAEGEKLMQISRDWSKAAAGQDVEKILSYWSDDAILYSGGEPTRNGKAAIRAMVEGSMKAPGFSISWEPKSADISSSGDLGYLLEETQIHFNDSTGHTMTQRFNSITVWKKINGEWKNVVDILSAE